MIFSLALALVALLPAATHETIGAQDTTRVQIEAPIARTAPPLWVTFSAGPGFAGGTILGLGAHIQSNSRLLGIRFGVRETASGHGGGFFSGRRYNSISDLSVMVGHAEPIAGPWQVVGRAGVGGLRGITQVPRACNPLTCFFDPTRQEISPVYLAVPLEVGVEGRLIGAIGLGFKAHAVLNAFETYTGASITLRVGPLHR
ncbi:hypothetical protein BH23BAC4_BH23BAC4_06040 [soil metagenome]